LPAPAEFSPPVPISADHDVSSFSCGVEALDVWLKQRAMKSEADRYARTYVVCREAAVVGYYALVMGSVLRSATSSKLRRNAPDPIPVIILARLAVDTRYMGHAIGAGLLKDALSRSLQASGLVGARAVLVHAISPEAVSFYARFGFAEFPSGSQTLFLPIESIAAAL